MTTNQSQDHASSQPATPALPSIEPPQPEPVKLPKFIDAYGNPRLITMVVNGPLNIQYVTDEGDLHVSDQQADYSGTQPASSEPLAQTQGDSFMDAHGNPRLSTTEQRSRQPDGGHNV